MGAVAAAFAVVAWLIVRANDSPKAAGSSTASVSARSLRALSVALGRPIYWAGPRHGVTYEFTETADRRVYVRYLPVGVRAGSPQPYLTVASYPVANAFAATRVAAKRPGAKTLPVEGGAVAFYMKQRPTNVYLAYPDQAAQVEVYDPAAGRMHKLVVSGNIRPVGRSTNAVVVATRATRTTPAALHRLAAQRKQPVYWLGRMPGRTLELIGSPDGRIYLRYLPAGVAPGSKRPYLTVATYPDAAGYRAAKSIVRQPGSIRIPLRNGAVAFYSRAHPTSVYVAFPAGGEQVEVFDPSAARVHQLVAAARVQPVP